MIRDFLNNFKKVKPLIYAQIADGLISKDDIILVIEKFGELAEEYCDLVEGEVKKAKDNVIFFSDWGKKPPPKAG